MVKVKRGKIFDFIGIYEVEKDSFEDYWSKETLVKELKNTSIYYYIIQIDNETIGFLSLMKILDEGHINRIAIKKSFRGKGYGRMLLNYTIGDMSEIEISSMTLEVRKKNKIARKLYESYGFVCEGLRKEYYKSPNDDALIYWKRK